MQEQLLWILCLTVLGIEAQNPCDIGPGEQIGELHDADIDEASGLAVSQSQPGILWTFNDHGEKVARVFAIGETGEKLVTFELDGAVNDDWEDIALHHVDGGSNIYVADTGNNDWDKEILTIYKFSEPMVNEADIGSTITIPASQISQYQIHWPAFSYDCEALAVEPNTGDIYLFTKDRENSISEVYRYPAPQKTEEVFTLEHVTTLEMFWITGADISPDGSILALTNKQEAFAWKKEAGQSWAEHLLLNPQPCLLTLEEEEQREAIAVSDTGYWTVSECKQCPVWFYPRNEIETMQNMY